jgi:two-component system CheB/CheR fusion protein
MGQSLANFMNRPSIKGQLQTVQPQNTDENNPVLAEIFQLLKRQSSINFSQYKPSTVARRIERRLGVNQLTTLEAYKLLLSESPREVQILSKELLIGVTRFFRDEEAFEKLNKAAINEILSKGNFNEPIRLWVAGCSSGEEAYSIAMLVDEAQADHEHKRQVKIFATDVDSEAIAEASAGVYSAEIVQDISAERLFRYFDQVDDKYTVSGALRKMVIFAQHNMIEDPPFSNINLVSCRNALIYFQPTAQQKVFASFYFALQQSGFLFLGNSESLGDMLHHFQTIDERNRLFQKVSSMRIPISQGVSVNEKFNTISRPSRLISKDSSAPSNPLLPAMEKLIEHYVPDCIVLNEQLEAIHVYGDVSRFTRSLSGGRVTTKLKDIIHQELSIPVSTALYRCEKENEDVFYKDITFSQNGVKSVIDLAIFVVKQGNHQSAPKCYIVQFVEHINLASKISQNKSVTFDASEQSKQRIFDLELELIKNQEHLQVTVEELETTNEELQSTNEELMSANEEMQSTNEELQSVNEELYTVNSEYQEKIQQLTEVNTDLDNVINSTDIGIIFLDESLTIRKFTSHATNYINILANDIGRPIHHISHELEIDDLLEKISKVSTTGNSVEKDVLTKSGQAVLLRIVPYTQQEAASEGNRGVLVTITNISRLKFVEEALVQAHNQFKSLLKVRSEKFAHRINHSKDLTILLLDDNQEDRATTNKYLSEAENREFNVIEASSIEDGLSIIQRVNIDLCLIDYRLRNESAIEFHSRLKASKAELPIILLSDKNADVRDTEFLQYGVIDIIKKVDMSKPLLVRSIDYVLERQEIKRIVEDFK